MLSSFMLSVFMLCEVTPFKTSKNIDEVNSDARQWKVAK
jgi:hypothetical protein